MSTIGLSVEEIGGVYDTFFREFFDQDPRKEEILAEYHEFKTEMLDKVRDLSEEEFSNYATKKKGLLRNKIQKTLIQNPRLKDLSGNYGESRNFGKNNFFIDFVRDNSWDIGSLDTFLVGFKNHQLNDVVPPGTIPNLLEFGKSQDNLIPKEIKKVEDYHQDISLKYDSAIQSFLEKNEKSYFRVFDSSKCNRSPLGVLYSNLFLASFERADLNFKGIVTYLLDLYNLSHFFGQKSDPSNFFKSFCNYLKQLLAEVTTKTFDSEASYLTCLLSSLHQTFHNDSVYKGFLFLSTSLIQTVLDFCNTPTLSKLLFLKPDDEPSVSKFNLSDFIEKTIQPDVFPKEGLDQHRLKIVRSINVLGYALGGSFDCCLLYEDLTSGNVPPASSTIFSGLPAPVGTVFIPQEMKMIFAYENSIHSELVKCLQESEPNFGIDDFMSLSDKNDNDDEFKDVPLPGQDKCKLRLFSE